MPVVIFHGDNSFLLGQKILEMKKSYPVEAIESASLRNESFEQLLIKFSSPSFFSDQRLFIVEDSDEKKIDPEKLKPDASVTIVFSFSKELSSSSPIIKWAEKNKFRIIGLSQPQDKRIFTFLDLLAEKNTKALTMLDDLITDFGVVYILMMLVFLLRRLTLPTGKVPQFVEQKLKKQKQNFPLKKLEELYCQTLEAEFKIKSGKGEEQTTLLLLVNSFLK